MRDIDNCARPLLSEVMRNDAQREGDMKQGKPVKTVWNTGRKYQAHGQIIAATQLPNCDVVFVDFSRMIDGTFTPVWADLSRGEIVQQVMGHYDSNDYMGWSSRYGNEAEAEIYAELCGMCEDEATKS
jgi:hypothetical protein